MCRVMLDGAMRHTHAAFFWQRIQHHAQTRFDSKRFTYSLSLFCWQRGSHKCEDFHMHVGCESYTCQCFLSSGGQLSSAELLSCERPPRSWPAWPRLAVFGKRRPCEKGAWLSCEKGGLTKKGRIIPCLSNLSLRRVARTRGNLTARLP
jgi:hypothetical protein